MTTHEFSLFVEGADLTAASTLQGLHCAGYTHPAAAAHDGVRALVFSRRAERLVDAVCAVVAETEQIPGLSIAREARGGAVAVFDPASMALAAALSVTAPAEPPVAEGQRPRRTARRSQHTDAIAS